MSSPESDLIARVLAREDQHAYGELVRRYQSPVRAFVTRLARGDTHLADDIAQETFLKAWQKFHTFRGGSRFSTWLFSIAYNEFCKFARKSGNLHPDEYQPAPEEAQPGSHSGTQARMDISQALDQLSPAQQAAIILCCQNGLSHEEAAQALSCPVGTVKSNILRGKEKLRKLLHEYREPRPA